MTVGGTRVAIVAECGAIPVTGFAFFDDFVPTDNFAADASSGAGAGSIALAAVLSIAVVTGFTFINDSIPA